MSAEALRRAAQVLFWLALASVAFVTLSPIADRPETPFGANAERFGAFAIISLLLMIAYPRRRLACLMGLVAVAGLLEAGQNLVPGRHGRPHDFAVKAAGVVAGAAMAFTILRAMAVSLAPRPRSRLL